MLTVGITVDEIRQNSVDLVDRNEGILQPFSARRRRKIFGTNCATIESPVMNTLWFTLVLGVELNEGRTQKFWNLDVETSN